MEVLFGGLTSILYGVADFLGGEGAKRAPAASIVLWAGIFSFPVIVIAALVVGGEASLRDYLIGAGAGVAGALGLVMLFAGLGRGHAAAVAPVSAALAAVVPVIGSVLGGERPSTLTWIGVAVAVPAIMLCAWAADSDAALGDGWLYGVTAGLGFGGFAVIIRFTSPSSNLLPLVASRSATMVIVLILIAAGVWKSVGFKLVPRPIVASSGLLDVAGNVALLVALRSGSVAAAAVAASFYPVVTVALARFINAEHLRTRQFVGLGLALMAMTAIALG